MFDGFNIFAQMTHLKVFSFPFSLDGLYVKKLKNSRRNGTIANNLVFKDCDNVKKCVKLTVNILKLSESILLELLSLGPEHRGHRSIR